MVWKNHFMNKLDPGPSTKLLDVAGGTGDIAFRFLDHVGKECGDGASVVVCDINKSMLEVGEERAKTLGYTSGVSWVEGALAEAYRVLKPGGRFMCLEFSKVTAPGV